MPATAEVELGESVLRRAVGEDAVERHPPPRQLEGPALFQDDDAEPPQNRDNAPPPTVPAGTVDCKLSVTFFQHRKKF